MKRACVFAHFDAEGLVDQHVIFYLQNLMSVASKVVFVTVSVLGEECLKRLSNIGVRVIERDNVGYDFYSYKIGLDQLDLKNYDEVILCNDSVYGPLYSLQKVFEQMADRPCHFWGLTESHEIAHHAQSYFLVFRRAVLDSEVFCRFWDSVVVLDSKRDIIKRYEVGLSQDLLGEGLLLDSLVSINNPGRLIRIRQSWRQYVRTMARRWKEKEFWLDVFQIVFMGRAIAINPTHMEWRSLLANSDLPFIKVELLRDNPKGVSDLSDVFEVIESQSDYPAELISNHLSRIRRQ